MVQHSSSATWFPRTGFARESPNGTPPSECFARVLSPTLVCFQAPSNFRESRVLVDDVYDINDPDLRCAATFHDLQEMMASETIAIIAKRGMM